MHDELRNKRIELGKTLEEISEETKIKKCCLRAIEEGNFDELPAEVYARAYIKTYAQYLNIDPSAILKEYDAFKERGKKSSQKVEIVQINEKSKKSENLYIKHLPRWSTTALIIISVLIIVIFLIKIEKKDEIIPPPPLPNQKETIVENTKNEEKIASVEQKEEILSEQNTLKIEATDKVWMRITIDDKEKREFLLNPGQTLELKADKSFRLHIGNAGGVRIVFNNKEYDKLGEIGQVVFLNLPRDKN